MHDNLRHGTSTLSTALDLAIRQDIATLANKQRDGENLAHLKQIERTYRHGDTDGRSVELHPVIGELRRPQARQRNGMAGSPRLTVHFTWSGPVRSPV